MGRPKEGEIWNHFTNGPSKSVKCKFCNKIYKVANATKMKIHLINCVKCPLDVRNSLKLKMTAVASDPLRDITNQPPVAASSRSSMLAPVQDDSSDCGDITPILVFNTVTEIQKNEMDRKLAKAIYVSGAPLSMVEHPLWKDFLNELQPSYKLPSRKHLSTTLLNRTYCETEQEVNDKVISATDLHMQLDGWSNVRNEGIINFLISTPEPVFVKYLNTECNQHTAAYISKEIIEVLKKYGEEKFFVLIGDNARNMQSALKIVQNQYHHIVPLGCVAHGLNLLCHDYLKCVSLNNIIDTATKIVKAIKSSQVLSALYAKIIKENKTGQQLKLPCKTRWGSNTASLESLQNSKASLQALAINERCNLTRNAKDVLLSEEFWEKISGTLCLLKPVSKWILEVESNKYNMCKVIQIFPEVEEPLASISDVVITDTEKQQLIEKINQRKRFCIKPIHLAAHMLDPRAQGLLLSTEEEIEAMSFIGNVASTLQMDNIIGELADYRSREGQLWGRTFVWSCVSQVNPVSWWKGICSSSKLSKIAVKILSAPTTSAATERSFSKFSFIHSKMRNRLTTDRAGKLTYIAYNWNLLSKNQGPLTQKDRDEYYDDSDEEGLEQTDTRLSEPVPSTSNCVDFNMPLSEISEPIPSISTSNLLDFNISSDSE